MPVVKSNAAPGTPCWVDLGIPDPQRAKEFYAAVFGWEYNEPGPDYGGYFSATKNGHQVAGMMGVQEAPTAWWGVYFATDDCDVAVQRAVDAGASVVAPAMDVGPLGRMAILQDPRGAQFGFWEGREHVGCELVDESGALAWNELVTDATTHSARFYESVLGVGATRLSQEGLDYLTLDVDEEPVAGVFGMPDLGDAGARWTVYFGVDDADEAARIAVEAGGSVARQPEDSAHGRVVVLRDPFGAEFAAIKLTPGPGFDDAEKH
ncbi:VOC family protein [Actinocorallia lasiicapitis]